MSVQLKNMFQTAKNTIMFMTPDLIEYTDYALKMTHIKVIC